MAATWRPALRQASPLGVPWPHYYTGDGFSVEVDRDAMEWDHETDTYGSNLPAVVVVEDYANWTVYSVVAEEDESGYARLLSLGTNAMDDPEDEGPGRYLHQRERRSEAWLARIAIESVRGAKVIAEPTDEDELLRRVAQVARQCAREGVSAADVLMKSLGVSARTVTRLRSRAVAAGFLDAHEGGRPRKFTPAGGSDA